MTDSLLSKTLDEINLYCRKHRVHDGVIWEKKPVVARSNANARRCFEIHYPLMTDTKVIVRVYRNGTFHDRYILFNCGGKILRLPVGDRFKYLRAEIRQFVEERLIPIASMNFGSNPWLKDGKQKMKRLGTEHVTADYFVELLAYIKDLKPDPSTHWQPSHDVEGLPAVFIRLDFQEDNVLIRMKRDGFGQPLIGFYINHKWYSPWGKGEEMCRPCNEIKQYLHHNWLPIADKNEIKEIAARNQSEISNSK